MHREIIKEISRITRKELQQHAVLTDQCKLISLSSLARLALLNKTDSVARLLKYSALASKHLQIINGKVSFVSQSAFDADLSQAKINAYNQQQNTWENINKLKPTSNAKNVINSLIQRSKLWKASHRKLFLTAVTANNGETTFNIDENNNALR